MFNKAFRFVERFIREWRWWIVLCFVVSFFLGLFLNHKTIGGSILQGFTGVGYQFWLYLWFCLGGWLGNRIVRRKSNKQEE
jgi:hypothetical protein